MRNLDSLLILDMFCRGGCGFLMGLVKNIAKLASINADTEAKTRF